MKVENLNINTTVIDKLGNIHSLMFTNEDFLKEDNYQIIYRKSVKYIRDNIFLLEEFDLIINKNWIRNDK